MLDFNWATAHYKIRFQMGQTYLNIFKYSYIIDYSTFEYSDIYSNIRICPRNIPNIRIYSYLDFMIFVFEC